jgi:hypothetical protein
MAAAGKDPRRAKEDTAPAMLDASRDTFGTLVEAFLATGGPKKPWRPKTWKGKGSACRISPAGLTGPVIEIDRRTVQGAVDDIAKVGDRTAMNARSALSAFFSWLVRRGVVDHSPMFGVEAPAPIPRTRYVDDSELAERAFNRLSRTFIAQVDALKKYRTGGEQKMTAEHVHVHEGGQAPMTGLCWKMRWTGCAGPNWRPTKCPKQDVFLDELPKTTTGEIRKVELREVVAEN